MYRLLLMISILLFLLSCSTTKVIYKTKYVYVTPPKLKIIDRPKLKKLNINKKISDPDNLEILIDNTIVLMDYIEKIELLIKNHNKYIDKLKKLNNVKKED